MQMSATQIQQMKKTNSPKQQAANRAGLLAQRLQMLKSMLSKLPPGDYKALLQEIKQIAKELKALSAQLKTSPAGGSLPGLSAAMSQAGANFVTPDANVPSDAGAAMDGAAAAAISAPVDVPAVADSVPDASAEAEGVVVDESAEADVEAEAQAATAAAETAAQQASATETTNDQKGLHPPADKTMTRQTNSYAKCLTKPKNCSRKCSTCSRPNTKTTTKKVASWSMKLSATLKTWNRHWRKTNCPATCRKPLPTAARVMSI
jgi:hypothetical protein